MANIIAFVPVRGGSKSIPLKNIKLFCGKPLVYWILDAFQNVDDVSKIVLATDSDEIEKVVRSFCLDKVEIYRRLDENATDTASTESVMLEYLNTANDIGKEDVFILAQATSPLTEPVDIRGAIELFNSGNIDSVVTCVRIKRFLWDNHGKPKNYDYMNRPRRQDFDGDLLENGAFYVSTVGDVLETKNRISGKIGIYEMPEYTSIEIDEEIDWVMAETIMNHCLMKKQAKTKIKLLLTDVDGVLTDSGMYYSEINGEMKKFNTADGMAFELLRNAGIKTGIVTSEITDIVRRRGEKIKADYIFQGKKGDGKLTAAKEICKKEGLSLSEIAYIGDDINCISLLSNVGVAACPFDANPKVKGIPNIIILNSVGGSGVVREFVDSYVSV